MNAAVLGSGDIRFRFPKWLNNRSYSIMDRYRAALRRVVRITGIEWTRSTSVFGSVLGVLPVLLIQICRDYPEVEFDC